CEMYAHLENDVLAADVTPSDALVVNWAISKRKSFALERMVFALRLIDATNPKYQTLRPAHGRAGAIGRRVLEKARVNKSIGKRVEGRLRFDPGERGAE